VNAVRHGMSNATIAKRRGISEDAVKYHVRNCVEKLGLKNRGELRHWRGVPVDSALAARAVGSAIKKEPQMIETRSKLGPIGQISRTVGDIDAACAWYGGVLGLTHLYTFGKLAFFDLGGTRLYLSGEQGTAGPESILYLRVEDIAAAHATLAERGVEFSAAPQGTGVHPQARRQRPVRWGPRLRRAVRRRGRAVRPRTPPCSREPCRSESGRNGRAGSAPW